MFRKLRALSLTALVSLPLIGLGGCSDDEETSSKGKVEVPAELTQQISQNYAKIVLASYEDSLEAAKALDARIADLVKEPSQAGLEAAKQAWLAAREPYLQTEVYRFYEGPIDNEAEGPEGLINAWPLDENYIDYVRDCERDETTRDCILDGSGQPNFVTVHTGIINDLEQNISADSLASLNEQGGEANIATGYHAIEFLLWGQDHNENGPGDRPYTDFVEGDDGTALNQGRRKLYLTTASKLLLQHLESLVNAWKADTAGNYRAEFEKASPADALRRILTGMVILSGFETGQERLVAALDAFDQEEEHSCFSDNTHRDMIQDVQGVLNVWLGTYTRTDGSQVKGPGIIEVVQAKDKELAAKIDARLKQALNTANQMEKPFDRAIAEGNTAGNASVQALIDVLRADTDSVEKLLQQALQLYNLTQLSDPYEE